ncbi:5672_t:CDS:2 [Dentiscutata erythropus]|uniref:5672_t:CDS:1 n=1 Tax=Dentiscutata erythropus TaxID=1348616 RepID=A0A9N8YRE9_9GLOM|nr:5672_t:CDS:2 [Dentiscutata erythropus]
MFEKKKEETHIFPTTSISELQDRPFPKTSAYLVIGDEILDGKTVDSNSGFFAKFCFNHGIYLKRIEVIPDKEEEIIEAVRRLSSNYDLVVTSGGIGPTHDDITYLSIARAYNLPLVYHQSTLDRMAVTGQSVSSHLKSLESKPTKAMIEAKHRMALFPQSSRVIFPHENFWVPIVIVNENIHILPGVPKIFEALLTGYSRYLLKGDKFVRKFVKTYYPESFIAPILTEAQEKVKDFGVKIGSYPEMTEDDKYVVVISFLAKGNAEVAEVVEKISKEVSKKIEGVIVD